MFNIGSASKAHFICDDGQNIKSNTTGTICITGVGGLTAYEILDGLSKNNFLNADRLILGPHRDENKLIELIKNAPKLNQYRLQYEIEVIESHIKRRLFILDKI